MESLVSGTAKIVGYQIYQLFTLLLTSKIKTVFILVKSLVSIKKVLLYIEQNWLDSNSDLLVMSQGWPTWGPPRLEE
jgi:hypothetical protein